MGAANYILDDIMSAKEMVAHESGTMFPERDISFRMSIDAWLEYVQGLWVCEYWATAPIEEAEIWGVKGTVLPWSRGIWWAIAFRPPVNPPGFLDKP